MTALSELAAAVATLEAAELAVDPGEVAALARAAAGDPARLLALARARLAGAPMEHLTGEARFLGLTLAAAAGVLAPRPETELLGRAGVELLAARAATRANDVRFVDLCCGAGNLACALAAHVPSATGFACDLTPACVALARRNVERLGLDERVTVLQGDLFEPLAGRGLEERVDVLVCNPPYISSGRLGGERAALLRHEPREAFDGGPYGLSVHQRVAREAGALVAPGGAVAFEVGEGQAKQVVLLLRRAGGWGEPELRYDARGVARVVLARREDG